MRLASRRRALPFGSPAADDPATANGVGAGSANSAGCDSEQNVLSEREVIERYERVVGGKPAGTTRLAIFAAGLAAMGIGAGLTGWVRATLSFSVVTAVGAGVTLWAPFMPSASSAPGVNYRLQSPADAPRAVYGCNRALLDRNPRASRPGARIRVLPGPRGFLVSGTF